MHQHFDIGTFMESKGHPCLKGLEYQVSIFVDGFTILLMDFLQQQSPFSILVISKDGLQVLSQQLLLTHKSRQYMTLTFFMYFY